MARSSSAALVIAAALLLSSACQNQTAPDTTPPNFGTLITETFTGTLAQGTAQATPSAHRFTVHTAVTDSPVEAALIGLAPLNTITLGLGMGVWDSAASNCALQLVNSASQLNVLLSAQVVRPGEYCVGVYDVGNVSEPVEYELRLTHY